MRAEQKGTKQDRRSGRLAGAEGPSSGELQPEHPIEEGKKMKRTFTVMAMVMALALSTMSVALAAVTFDSESGEGFVGKGDVQTALGWNNAQLQANANGLVFAYGTSTTVAQECRDNVNPNPGQPQWVYDTRTDTRSVGNTVAYDARKQNQVSGFFLIGYSGETTSSGSLQPSCPAGYEPFGQATVTRVSTVLTVDGVPVPLS
jgi:hypothetical protein